MKSKNLNKQSGQKRSMHGNINSLGICLGASTVSIVHVIQKISEHGRREAKPEVVEYSLHSHEGNPKQTLLSALKSLDMNSYDRIAVTGRRFRKFVNLSSISEPELSNPLILHALPLFLQAGRPS
jgi:hypothetical protein